MKGAKGRTLQERFDEMVDRDGPIPANRPDLGPCHEWIGYKNTRTKRAQMMVDGEVVNAARVAFFLKHGRWPEPMACHHCDNVICVNEAHIFEGTKSDNARDMVAKGRHGTWTHPENRARGATHGSRTMPERTARGDRIGTSKLNAEKVEEIRKLLEAGGLHAEIAERFQVSRPAITLIATGKTWKRS